MKELKDLVQATTGTELTAEGAWGYDEVVDVATPNLLLVQNTTDLGDDVRKILGNFFDTHTNTDLGDSVEIIPIKTKALWQITEKSGGKTVAVFPRTHSGLQSDLGDIEFDEDIHNSYKRISLLCLIPSLMEQGDDLPRVISFKSTSFKTGMAISTFMNVTCRKAGKSPASSKMVLGREIMKNAKNKYAVLNHKHSEDTSSEDLKVAFKVFQEFGANF